MPEIIDRRWEHKKAISPLPLGGPSDPGGLARSVLVDAAHDGYGPVHFVQRHLQNALLLLEGQRRHLRSVGVGGDACHPRRVDQIAQVPAVVLLVDLQLGIESHQIGGYDTPENQLRPHWKTSPRSCRGGYSSIPTNLFHRLPCLGNPRVTKGSQKVMTSCSRAFALKRNQKLTRRRSRRAEVLTSDSRKA